MTETTVDIICEQEAQFTEKLIAALEYADIKTFKAEAVYQKLLALGKHRSDDEEIVFQVMDLTRKSFDEINKLHEERVKLLTNLPNHALIITKHMYYDWDAEPIEQWEWYFKNAYFCKSVGQDIINGWRVSTIWMGLNHSYFPEHVALIFETMIFKEDQSIPDNEFCDGFQERYSTYEHALEGHKQACEEVKYLKAT